MWHDILLSLSVFHWPSMKKDIINQKIKKIEEGKKIKIEKKIEKNQKFGYLII